MLEGFPLRFRSLAFHLTRKHVMYSRSGERPGAWILALAVSFVMAKGKSINPADAYRKWRFTWFSA